MSLLRSSLRVCVIIKCLQGVSTSHNSSRSVARWVGPTLRELRKRSRKLCAKEPQPRSGFIEWNYRAELFAFGKRLNEDFRMPLLQTAFTQRSYILQEEKRQRDLGVEQADIQMQDNRELATHGEKLAREYVDAYLQYSLPKLPAEGLQSFASHLLSTAALANIASHLGMKDIILAAEYPPLKETLAQTLLAVIGALAKSSGVERAFLFVRDFICTQLNQRDLSEMWPIEHPEELLVQICREQKLPAPEARLIGECGKNTVLAAYEVGIYGNKKLLGSGFGEDVTTAVRTAYLNALHSLFGMQDHRKPFEFQLHVQPKSDTLSPN